MARTVVTRARYMASTRAARAWYMARYMARTVVARARYMAWTRAARAWYMARIGVAKARYG